MPAPDPLAGTPEEFTIADWKECVGNFRASGPNSFSAESGEASLTGYVPAAKVRGALRFFLGYSTVPQAGPRLIQRTNPVYHPRYTNLVCTGAAEEEFAPDAGGLKKQANNSLDYGGSPLLAAPKVTHRSGYKRARVTLRFQPVPYQLASDADIDDLPGSRADNEHERNTWIEVDPKVETISLDGFTLRYAEGQANTPPLTNPFGKDFPAPFGQLLAKPDLVFNWKSVPKRFLESAGGPSDLPVNIVNCLGKVNDAAFRGYAAGTLLLLGAKMAKVPWPLAMGSETSWNYNVTFMFSFFDPPKGKTGDVQIVTNRGHNNLPYRGELAAGDTNAGRWFLATRTGGAGVAAVDPRLLEESSFLTMFRQPT